MIYFNGKQRKTDLQMFPNSHILLPLSNLEVANCVLLSTLSPQVINSIVSNPSKSFSSVREIISFKTSTPLFHVTSLILSACSFS